MTMFKSKNTLPPLRETDKKDPMLKTRFLPPAHFASDTRTPTAPLQTLPVMSAGACQGPACERECACPALSAPALVTSMSAGTAPHFTLGSIGFAPYCLRVGRIPGKKNHTRHPHRPRPPATSLYFASHYHNIPTPESTSLAYLVPSTASAQYCATTTPALR